MLPIDSGVARRLKRYLKQDETLLWTAKRRRPRNYIWLDVLKLVVIGPTLVFAAFEFIDDLSRLLDPSDAWPPSVWTATTTIGGTVLWIWLAMWLLLHDWFIDFGVTNKRTLFLIRLAPIAAFAVSHDQIDPDSVRAFKGEGKIQLLSSGGTSRPGALGLWSRILRWRMSKDRIDGVANTEDVRSLILRLHANDV